MGIVGHILLVVQKGLGCLRGFKAASQPVWHTALQPNLLLQQISLISLAELVCYTRAIAGTKPGSMACKMNFVNGQELIIDAGGLHHSVKLVVIPIWLAHGGTVSKVSQHPALALQHIALV